MFVYSLRANTLKFFAVVCVALTALITMITFIPEYDAGGLGYVSVDKDQEIRYDGVKTEEDRVGFLSQFGWSVSGAPVEVAEVRVPEEFDKIFAGYNEIQKRQGLDLSKYKGKELSRYTYEISNYEGATGKVYANILVYRNKVVGGDICSADTGGFIHGFDKS